MSVSFESARNAPPPNLRCIALAGPTASGKTAAAMAIARHYADTCPVEIISVDSALVYRDMDIGTAKPSAFELAAVPHHLIDIRDPLSAYSAAEFVQDARRLVREISARGGLPLLVGGTMLYFKALRDGLDALPPADPAREAQQIARLRALAVDARLDPEFAEKFLGFIVAEVVRHHEAVLRDVAV